MQIKIISWEYSGRILEYHQSCNDWVTVDWITTLFSITQVAFDIDWLEYFARQDREQKSGIRYGLYELYERAVHDGEPYRYAYRSRGKPEKKTAWNAIKKQNKHLKYDM